MSSSPAKVQRSWTDSEDAKPQKWFWITVFAILLAITVAFFIYFMQRKKTPVTYVTGLAVSKYPSLILPQPAHPTWDFEALNSAMPEQGLQSWKVSTQVKASGKEKKIIAVVSTTNEVVQRLDTLRSTLEKDGLEEKDTVVVYLRGHAINHRGKAFLLTGEFERKNLFLNTEDAKEELEDAVSLEQVFRYLQKVNAAQVVVLADFCDLPTVPTLGIIANDVPALVGQELSRVSGGTPLWVITASASFQPSHSSNLKNRTLLQSASEYALNSRHATNADGFLSLADFYHAILRYSSQATEGQQTPLLFRSGSETYLKDENSKDWKNASAVSIARRDSTLREISKKVEDAAQPKTSSKPASRIAYVSAQETASSTTTGKEKEAASADAKNEPQKNLPETPFEKYWSLRDAFSERNADVSPQGWSPVDFAAKDWLTTGLEAVQLERLLGIGDPKAKEQIQGMTKELADLKEAFQSSSSAGKSTSKFVQAWQTATRRMNPESDTRAWLYPKDLPESLQMEWTQKRENYRLYFDAMGQLSGWLSAALNENGQNRTKLISLVEKLVIALADLQTDLPKANDSLWEKDLPDNKLAAISSALDKLKESRNAQVSEVVRNLKNPKLGSWADERAALQLLQDTNLTYSDRKEITSIGLKLNEPGAANNDDQNLDLATLLNPSEASVSLDHYATWCKLYSRAIKLVTGGNCEGPTARSAGGLNIWGHELIARFANAAAERDPTLCWKQACLNELQLFQVNEDGQSGMLLSVSKDETIEFKILHSTIQLSSEPRELPCVVKRRNGTSIPDCWLTWELIKPENFQGDRRSLLNIKLKGEEKELDAGAPHQTKNVREGKVELMLSSAVNSKKFDQDVKIGIAIASQETAKISKSQEVQVLLPNPDQIELYAKCLNPAANESGIVRSKINKFGTVVLSSLSVPAVDGKAKSRYELYLVNRSDEDKTVQAKLYAVEGGVTNGNGSIPRSPSLPSPSSNPLFQTTSPIKLSKTNGQVNADGSPAGAVRIELVQVQTDANKTPITQSTGNIGEFGLVLAIEEIEVVENQPPRPLKKDKIYQWIDCNYTNPFGNLVVIKHVATKGTFDFDVEVPKENWERWGLKDLEINTHLTDSRGVELASDSRSRLLNPDMPTAAISVKPKLQPSNGKPVLHIDIGGYPRAIAFDSPLQGESGETRNAAQAFVWLVPDGTVFATKGKDTITPIPLPTTPNTLIVPNRELTTDGPVGKEITLTKLSMPFRFDFPNAGFKSAEFLLGEGNLPQKYLYDREFIPTFEVEGGNLVYSATVQDLRADFTVPKGGFFGTAIAKATITETSGTETKDTCSLVFDKTPPTKARVDCSANELYAEESLEISIEITDDESPTKRVYFTIDQDGINEGIFDEEDVKSSKISLKAVRAGDTWSAPLEAKAFENENLRIGKYRVVARSIDLAGNVQDENTPGSFSWRGKRKAPKPASNPPPKKKPVAPPKKSEPQSVTVQVTVEGKEPSIHKNIQVKGIPGESEIKNGTTTIFTKVPDGVYDATVSYKDTFGKSFEGAAKIKVSADSIPFFKIDAKSTK